MTNLVYLDTETTGLDPEKHEVWEIAYAVNDGPIRSSFVDHDPPVLTAETVAAFRVNGYLDRLTRTGEDSALFESFLMDALTGATVVGSNPAFDTAFLQKRWRRGPWHHRFLALETYAMPYLRSDRPVGLAKVAEALGVVAPDHTAAGDVHVLRECHRILSEAYSRIYPEGE